MAVLLLALLLAACGGWDEYTGDGELRTCGLFAQREDYLLDLGPLDSIERRYVFSGLPPAEFIFGIEFEGLEGAEHCVPPPTSPLVRMRLTADDGALVFDVNGPLIEGGDTWRNGMYRGACEGLFVYSPGEYELDRDVEGRAVAARRVGMGPHGGWGSEMLPQAGAEYVLEVKASWTEVPGHRLHVKALGFKQVADDGAAATGARAASAEP